MLARERRATREERAADLKEAIFMSAIERGTPGSQITACTGLRPRLAFRPLHPTGW